MATLIVSPGSIGIGNNVGELVGHEKLRPSTWGSPVYADDLSLEDAESAKALIEEALEERKKSGNPFPFSLTITIEE